MGRGHGRLQCLTDMPSLTLGDALAGVGYAQPTNAVQGRPYESCRGLVFCHFK